MQVRIVPEKVTQGVEILALVGHAYTKGLVACRKVFFQMKI